MLHAGERPKGEVPPRRRRAARRRHTAGDFVNTALALLEQHGAQAVTARRLAREMRLSQMALYRHFDGMDHLLSRVWNLGFTQLIDFVTTADAEAGGGLPGFRESLKAYAQFGVNHPWLYRFMFSTGPRLEQFGEENEGLRSMEILEKRVVALKEEGYIAAEDDLAAVSLHLWFLHHGLTTLAISGQAPKAVGVELDRLIESTADRALSCFGITKKDPAAT